MIPLDIKPWCSEVFPSPQAASSSYIKRDYSFRGMFLCFNVLHEVEVCSLQVTQTSQSGVCKCCEHKPGLHAMMWEFNAVAQSDTAASCTQQLLPPHHTQMHLRQHPKMHQLSVIFHILKDLQVY